MLWSSAPLKKSRNDFSAPCPIGKPPVLSFGIASSRTTTPSTANCRGRGSQSLIMPAANCLRSFSQLSLDATVHSSATARLLRPRVACFSTSAARYAVVAPKKKNMAAAPKKGVKTLNTKKTKGPSQADMGKRPAPGERKAQRKRIVLSNNNALEVSSLKDLTKANVLSEANEGLVMGLPEAVVDALRDVDAFKTTQGWSFFRRPAVLMRKEAVQLAQVFKGVEEAATGQDKRTARRILTGKRMSGKSTLLLQGLSVAFLRQWFVINLPECKCSSFQGKRSTDCFQAKILSTHTPTMLPWRALGPSNTPKILTPLLSCPRFSRQTKPTSSKQRLHRNMNSLSRYQQRPNSRMWLKSASPTQKSHGPFSRLSGLNSRSLVSHTFFLPPKDCRTSCETLST